MKSPVMFDVLLPYYGDHPLFRESVMSVLAQTERDWRLICVDDAHPSGSARGWVESLGDPRIVHVRNDSNLGVAGNFSRCLELTSAPWFTMMGSDDIMRPEHLSEARRRLVGRDDVAIVQGGVLVIDDAGTPVKPLADQVKALLRPQVTADERILRDQELAASLTRADWAYFPSLIWRTDQAKRLGFRSEYAIALDLGLLLDVAIDGGAMLLHDTTTFEYRRHRASVSMTAARTGERFEQERRFFLDYAQRFQQIGWKRPARIARRHSVSRLNALSEIPGALKSGGFVAGRRLLSHVIVP